MKHLIFFLISGICCASLHGQAVRSVIRTNARMQIIRLYVNEENRIVRRQLIGMVAEEEPAPREVPYDEPAPEPQPEARPSGITHLIGFSAGFLVQNAGGLGMLSTVLDPNNINTTYAGTFQTWRAGSAAVGMSLGFAYTLALPNMFTFLMHFNYDTTGWHLGSADFGIGARIPIRNLFYFSIDAYFGMGFTGAELPPLTDAVLPAGSPSNASTFISLFGFKGRAALEFSVGSMGYISVFISYTAYPWAVSTGQVSLNGAEISRFLALDALKIGVEIGIKLPR